MLFVPPSIPSMIPEAFAAPDNGDFKLVYYQTANYTSYERWIQSTNYFEDQVAWLNQEFRLPYDVTIVVDECGMTNAWFDPDKKEIVYCYEFIDYQFNVMRTLDQVGYSYAPSIFCSPSEVKISMKIF